MLLKILLYPFWVVFKLEEFIFKALFEDKRTFNKVNSNFAEIKVEPKKVIKQKVEPKPKKKERKELERQVLLMNYQDKDTVKHKNKVKYKYVVKDENDKIVNGEYDAYSKLEVHSFLISQGWTVYEINEDKFSTFFGGVSVVSNKKKLKPQQLAFFLTQLSTYVKSGITLVDSVKILSKQIKDTHEKKLYQSIVYELNSGVTFSDAMLKQGDAFPKLLINMVKTSEMTGQLTITLDDMADYYMSIYKTKKQIISALTYPAVIFVISIAVVVFLILYIVPQFVNIYDQNDMTLPGITNFIIGVSNFMKFNALWVGIGLIIFILLFSFLYKNVVTFRYVIQWLGMHIPVVKTIIINKEIFMFTKTFSSLVNHDVFITDSMDILEKITENEIYKNLINDAITNLSAGLGISVTFKNHWAFPQVAYEMLATGEKTGKMGEMLTNVANHYQEQENNLVTQLKSLIEPIMIVLLAVIVGLIVLAIVIPMFDMYKNIM